MYNALIGTYSRVHHGRDSPLSSEWKINKYQEAFNNDRNLIDAFEELIITDRAHCELVFYCYWSSD
jgi:hypothetical protein